MAIGNPGSGGESVEFGIETSIAKTRFLRPEDPFYLAGDHLQQVRSASPLHDPRHDDGSHKGVSKHQTEVDPSMGVTVQ